jgi:hypothetical protein
MAVAVHTASSMPSAFLDFDVFAGFAGGMFVG